ncbi:MAG: transglycosylase SLT domain-containing protein [Dysgonamonadaceae bacterium]|jgi:membrane-bound lytic murein transglycosylase D|nr:transglycosylase SLT domain-containing protein [Dysgonamonadaceae bacterium]
MNKVIKLLSIFFICASTQAQDYFPTDLETDASDFIVPEDWDANWDKLVNSWYIKHYAAKVSHEGYRKQQPVNDATYIERLSQLPNVIKLPYNAIVKKCIEQYIRRRSSVEYLLAIDPLYFPMIEETLDKYDLPLELKYLTIVESSLNPTARSRRGAAGLWQFMIATGKSYGLEINSLVDDRMDPVKSTDAACRYLKDLFDIYGEWNLVIAAYNCGAGNVNKAIRRSNGKKDFWQIYQYLPRETRVYVPLFIAANYMMNCYAYHQLYPAKMETPVATDTVMINRRMDFSRIAAVLNISIEELRALNPQYRRDVIPGNGKPYVLKLPTSLAYAFAEKEPAMASSNAQSPPPVVENVATQPAKTRAVPTIGNIETTSYQVQPGESYYIIAKKFSGYDASDLMRLNNTRNSALREGQYILVPKI